MLWKVPFVWQTAGSVTVWAAMMLKSSPWPVILQIIPELSAGGAERTTIEMAEAITLAGGRALVASAGGRLEKELESAGGELIPFGARTKNPGAILFNAIRLSRLIVQRGVSLVHARSRAPAWSAFLAARRTRRVFVTTYHGVYNQKSRLKGLYNGVMARGDAIICNSNYTAAVVRERHPNSAERLAIIHRGVDVAKFDPAAVSEDRVKALRQAWGVAPGARIVLLPARLTRWKGQQVLIEAAARLRDLSEAGDVQFVLAGDEQGRTAYRSELEEMIRTLGLEGKVVLAGHCEDMPAAYKAAAFTVIPSVEAEAFGRVSIEAQAMGCPVIVANIGALPETIPPCKGVGILARVASISEAGSRSFPAASKTDPWLFEPGNAVALGESIRRALLLSEESLAPIRSRAIEHARTHFSKRVLQAQTLAVYDNLLGTQLAEAFRSVAKS